ncbi:MAG: LysR family transcriptional regulator [Zoogloea sp.]|nr:LysR family transcriptional regulator [Zoogloea sp.]
MEIEANDLMLFARVADCGSFSRGAERTGLPKSTVSRRIAALETALGERLFLRSTRRLALTEFGTSLLDHAHRLAEEVDAAAALAQHRQAEPSGRLRVSMPSDFAAILLPRMLAEFRAQHAGVDLEIDLSPRRVDLLGENFDLAIRMGDLPDDATLVARRLCEIQVGLFASPAYLARAGRPAHPDELQHHACLRLLGRNGEALAWHLKNGEADWLGEVPHHIQANSVGLLMNLALEGAGIAALPERFARLHLEGGLLQRILPDWRLDAATAWAVLPGRRLLPAKTRAFVDMLFAALQNGAPVPVACQAIRFRQDMP